MTSAIELAGLKKRFRRLEVLRGVDCRIRSGCVTALVGPNGAGKSTLIKILLGLTRADSGRAVVLGHCLDGSSGYRNQVGYMPQAAHFPENLRGLEVLNMVRSLRGPGHSEDRELLDAFALGPELTKPVRTLSGGNRQKLNAALAFLFRPDLLILDEPTAGLDPIASGILKQQIGAALEAGATILIASHVMSELEELATDIVFLLEGTVRFQGSIAELKATAGEDRLERAVARTMLAGPR
ncbi:MAG: ABC transporter ATP-binding protein [Gemmatimonadota bacterium]